MRQSLDFVFEGYTIWLEPKQFKNDFSNAITQSSLDLNIESIPRPHATAIYGMTHFDSKESNNSYSQEEGEKRVLEIFQGLKLKLTSWPTLQPVGFLTDFEENGVNGGLMDLIWSEVTFKSSEEHEAHLDILYKEFFDSDPNPVCRSKMWRPHISLAYDNLDTESHSSDLNLSYTYSLIQKYPSLLLGEREIEGISLWNTNGKMKEWKLLDRYTFESYKATESISTQTQQ